MKYSVSSKKTFLFCFVLMALVLCSFLPMYTMAAPPNPRPPKKIQGLVVTVVPEGNSLELDWEKGRPKDLAHFNIYRSTTAGFIPDLENPTATSVTNHYLDINLTAGITYYYRVSAVDTANNIGEPSDEASGTPIGADTIPPEKILNLTVSVIPSGNELELNWGASVAGDLDHYNIYRSTSAGFTPGSPNLIATPTTISYLDSGLTDGVTYYYRVSAVDTANNIGEPSDEASGVPQDTTPPAKVSGLMVTVENATGDMLDLYWDPCIAPDLAGYKIYRSTTPGFTPSSTNLIATSTWNFYLDMGLTSGVTYYYRVSAFDEVPNEGLVSDEASGTP